MTSFSSLESLPKHGIHQIALTMGIFDGMHLGHQKILSRLIEVANQTQAIPIALTFSPHPREVIHGTEVSFILPLSQRLDLIESYGVKATVTLPFTDEFASLPPEAFLDYLFSIKDLTVTAIVVGSRWIFGKNGKGNIDYLMKYAQRKGFIFIGVNEVETQFGVTSSTLIRQFITAGACEKVIKLLGRPYSLEGKVIDGEKIASTKLETPTANVHFSTQLLPPNGVYAVYAEYQGTRYEAIGVLGLAPTFDFHYRHPRLEVHFFNQSLSLYGEHVKVEFLHLIRVEKQFDSIELLKVQIQEDLKQCQDFFK